MENKKLEEEIIKKIRKENKTMNKTIAFAKKHPILIPTMALVVASGIYCGITRQAYCTAAEGEVIEEKYVYENENTKHYVLFMKVMEEVKNKEEFYVLRVKENEEMPVAVLDNIIQPGMSIAFPYLKPRFLTGTPDFVYTPARFGTIASNEIMVIHPWESSETVRNTLEKKVEERKEKEYERFMTEVRMESGAYHY